MFIRFFKDPNNEDEIYPRISKDDTYAHYAWCLNQLINDLENSNDDNTRKNSLEKFAINMNLSSGTKNLLGEFSGLFAQLFQSNPLPSNEYIINCLKGMPADKDRIYLSYTLDLKPKYK